MQSQYDLGVMLYEGEGLIQNFAQAIKYFELAANQGHPDAYFNLGVIYAEGEGVQINLPRAYAYLRFADVLGAADTHEALDEISRELSAEDMIQANFYFEELGRSTEDEQDDWY